MLLPCSVILRGCVETPARPACKQDFCHPQRACRNSRRRRSSTKVGAALRAVRDSRGRRAGFEAAAAHAGTWEPVQSRLPLVRRRSMRRPGFLFHAPHPGVTDGSESRPYLGLRTPAAGVSTHSLSTARHAGALCTPSQVAAWVAGDSSCGPFQGKKRPAFNDKTLPFSPGPALFGGKQELVEGKRGLVYHERAHIGDRMVPVGHKN